MDQDRVAFDRREPGADRLRAMLAALDEAADVRPGQSVRCELVLSRRDHHPDVR